VALPQTQRAILITAPGGPEVLQMRQLPVEQPGMGEVLVQVGAAGVNRHDTGQRRAGPGIARTDVPGLEVAGTIVAVGEGVDKKRIGERVCALIDGGGYAEYALAQEPLCFPVPSGFDDLTAAALPEAMFTVWFNIFELCRLQKNEIALIHGGTSGVGSLGIMTLSALGYKVMATCGSAEKCEAARAFGAVAAFDYHAADLANQIKAETKKAGLPIGVILDMSAGAHLEDDFEVIGFGGRIVHLTPGSNPNLPIRLSKMMAKQIWVTGSRMRPLAHERKLVVARRLREDIWSKFGPALKPTISATFPLDQAAQAHTEMELGRHIGKIMIVPK
jgi:putative PIG3 family NAD(P)H quinone oxidoreductase